MFHTRAVLLCTGVLLCPVVPLAAAAGTTPPPGQDAAVSNIRGIDHLKALLDSSGERLLVFDLYADWCLPCRVLSPMLEQIAREHADKAGFYKVNIDKHPDIAGAFGVMGIPFVVFVKNKTGVHALTGVHPKDRYVRDIVRFAGANGKRDADMPDGDIVEGVRVIALTTHTAPGRLYVYRGETVRLVIRKLSFSYSVHIPEFGISEEGAAGEDLQVEFKAVKVGVFPIFCNGNCPVGDGESFGQIVVMQYRPGGDTDFREIGPARAKELAANPKVLVLDVRTPNEYYAGHLPNARLMPLNQLEARISEIAAHGNSEVLLYCRSGNRSVVAAEILVKHGFRKLYHLRDGLKGWKKAGLRLVKAGE